MKLRISGNSIRLRLLQSEVAALSTGTRLEEKLHLGAGPAATLTYALQCGAEAQPTAVTYANNEITVVLACSRVRQWSAANDEVGIYDTLDVAADRPLDIIVEKDFACLDGGDAENADTFPNPLHGNAC